MKSLIGTSVGAALLLAASVTPGHATAITLTGTGTGGLKASVTFDDVVVSGNHYLQVTLTNTGNYNASKPTDILTGVFFNIQGSNPTLTGFSATLAPGSTVKDINPDPTNLGGEWAYRRGCPWEGSLEVSPPAVWGSSAPVIASPAPIFRVRTTPMGSSTASRR
jgi:hypothetical protein